MATWILSALFSAVVGGGSDCTLVHFTATWCEPCKQIQPALQQLHQEGWAIQTVDVDRHPELVKKFHIENLPTLAIVCRDQEVDRLVGAASHATIHERLQRAAARNESGSHNHAAEQLAAAVPRTNSLQPIVRGQSPGLTAFPLLATVTSEAARSNAVPSADIPTSPSFSANPSVGTGATSSATTASPTAEIGKGSMAEPSALGGANRVPAHTSAANSPSPTLTTEQAIARAAAATVRIRVDEANTTAYGTGTIVDVRGQEALILTCGHLFREMNPNSQLTIDLFPGTPQEVNLPSELIDFKAEGEDIGLISFRLPTPIEPVPILGRGEPLAVGQPAFSFGCDHGANPTRRDTRIRNINRYLGADNIEIVGAPAVGRSGGGLFDLQGRLIGVCNAANAEDDEGIYAAAEVVYSQIERLGLSELFDGSRAKAKATTPAQLASSAAAPGQQGWQPSATAPVAVAATEDLGWPDQNRTPDDLVSAARGAEFDSPSSDFDGSSGVASAAPQPAKQLICIVRDASGTDKVVTIDAPPPHLLQLIQQSAQN